MLLIYIYHRALKYFSQFISVTCHLALDTLHISPLVGNAYLLFSLHFALTVVVVVVAAALDSTVVAKFELIFLVFFAVVFIYLGQGVTG